MNKHENSPPSESFETLGSVAFQYIIFIALIGVILHFLSSDIGQGVTYILDSVELFIINAKAYSFIAYVFVVALIATSPMPSSSLAVLGGYLFGTWWAILLTLLGELLGAIANYYIGKGFGTVLMDESRFPNVARFLKKYTHNLSPATVFLLGIIPVGTTNVTGYAAAISGMSLKQFTLSWTLGVSLMVVATTLLGYSARLSMPWFSVLVIVGSICTFFVIRYFLKRSGKDVQV